MNAQALPYFEIIRKYIPPNSLTYAYYLPHVAAVTAKALRIAYRLGLDATQRRFIEEAAMLHDIGIVRVHAPDMGCTGELPYITHILEGRRILEAEGLPRHALVAERHVGVGLTQEEIVSQGLPLPAADIFPESLEETLISWADLFFSKSLGELWRERSVAEARQHVARWGERPLALFDVWRARFEEAT
ncbi:MAG TPA: phosphohydrolase [Anaerolineae bacterium]|nr:phosphohydrolase [Anaerolineae bacterium]